MTPSQAPKARNPPASPAAWTTPVRSSSIPASPPPRNKSRKRKKGEMVDALEDGRFVVVDGFGHPFQYLVAIRDRNGRITNSGDMHSGSDFEIWSYGTLEERDDTPQGQAEWVTSWQ